MKFKTASGKPIGFAGACSLLAYLKQSKSASSSGSAVDISVANLGDCRAILGRRRSQASEVAREDKRAATSDSITASMKFSGLYSKVLQFLKGEEEEEPTWELVELSNDHCSLQSQLLPLLTLLTPHSSLLTPRLLGSLHQQPTNQFREV